ncbi:hypothetical protein P9112_000229 [Eukaryota sp. TZLM1-RC]
MHRLCQSLDAERKRWETFVSDHRASTQDLQNRFQDVSRFIDGVRHNRSSSQLKGTPSRPLTKSVSSSKSSPSFRLPSTPPSEMPSRHNILMISPQVDEHVRRRFLNYTTASPDRVYYGLPAKKSPASLVFRRRETVDHLPNLMRPPQHFNMSFV